MLGWCFIYIYIYIFVFVVLWYPCVSDGEQGSCRKHRHVSQLAKRFFWNPFDLVSAGDVNTEFSCPISKGRCVQQLSLLCAARPFPCSVQVNMESVRSEKPICAPPRLSEVSPTLPLNQIQCSSDWRWLSLVLSSCVEVEVAVLRFPSLIVRSLCRCEATPLNLN